MFRLKLIIEYDGSDFCGWQLQTNGRSVQGALEDAARRVLQEPVRVHGAGRTDAGVHARGQVAHFDTASALAPDRIMRALNAVLPADVCVVAIEQVDGEFHARFSASSRSYEYAITHRRLAYGRQYAWSLYAPLQFEGIMAAVPRLEGTHDFTALSKHAENAVHHRCHVFQARWMHGEDRSVFFIRANRFMYGMVRAIVSGLVEVGRGKRTAEEFTALLDAGDRSRTPPLAPSCGLTLMDVRYDRAERELIGADRIFFEGQ